MNNLFCKLQLLNLMHSKSNSQAPACQRSLGSDKNDSYHSLRQRSISAEVTLVQANNSYLFQDDNDQNKLCYTLDPQQVSNDDVGPELTHTENFELQNIEQFQEGDNTIIRNLDLEGDDFYDEEFDEAMLESEQLAKVRVRQRSADSEEYENDDFEKINNAFPSEVLLSEMPSIPHDDQGIAQVIHESAKMMNQMAKRPNPMPVPSTIKQVKMQKQSPFKKNNPNVISENELGQNYVKKYKKRQSKDETVKKKPEIVEKPILIQGKQAPLKDQKITVVDTIVIGSGPSALGFLVNAIRTGRLNDLIRSKDGQITNNNGLAILSDEICLGGGFLGDYGINSNTSAAGFVKCLTRQNKTKKVDGPEKLKTNAHLQPAQNAIQNLQAVLKETQQRQKARSQSLANKKLPMTIKPQPTKVIELKLGQLVNEGEEIIAKIENETKPDECLMPFKELYEQRITKCLKSTYAKSVIPLPVVGHFLNYVGNHLLFYIFQLFSTNEKQNRIFYPYHKVQQIQLLSNGECQIKVLQTKFKIVQPPENNHVEIEQYHAAVNGLTFTRRLGPFELWISATSDEVYFKSKSVILANGGSQCVHPEFFNWFPSKQQDQVVSSDYFLKKEGFHQTLLGLGRLRKPQCKKKIVIIGGSHSGFSCAWMLLNQLPAHELQSQLNQITVNKKAPGGHRRTLINCNTCCSCQLKQPEQKCKICVCKCFGFFEYNEWRSAEVFSEFPNSQPLNFGVDTDQITILYRDEIKVFYQKVKDAIQDGYTGFDKQAFQNENGYLYSFTGLRGDAKELFRNIMKGKEKRVRLVQAATVQQQAPFVKEADLVIWACGYQTKKIDIVEFSQRGKNMKPQIVPLKLSQMNPGTQYDVDNKCRVILQNNIVLNKVFACGIGYPVRTNDGKTVMKQQGNNDKRQNPRADGFSLYMNIVGDILIKNILPKDLKFKVLPHKIYPLVQPMAQKHSSNLAVSKSPFKAIKAAVQVQNKQMTDSAKQQKLDSNKKQIRLHGNENQMLNIKAIKLENFENRIGCFSAEHRPRVSKSSQRSNASKIQNRQFKISNMQNLIESEQEHNLINEGNDLGNKQFIQFADVKQMQLMYQQMQIHTEMYQPAPRQCPEEENYYNNAYTENFIKTHAQPEMNIKQSFSDFSDKEPRMQNSRNQQQRNQVKTQQQAIINKKEAKQNVNRQPDKIKALSKSPYVNVYPLEQMNQKHRAEAPMSQPTRKTKMKHKQIEQTNSYSHMYQQKQVEKHSKVVQALMNNVLHQKNPNLVDQKPEFIQSSDMFPPINSKNQGQHLDNNSEQFQSRYSNLEKFKRDTIIKHILEESSRQQRITTGQVQLQQPYADTVEVEESADQGSVTVEEPNQQFHFDNQAKEQQRKQHQQQETKNEVASYRQRQITANPYAGQSIRVSSQDQKVKKNLEHVQIDKSGYYKNQKVQIKSSYDEQLPRKHSISNMPLHTATRKNPYKRIERHKHNNSVMNDDNEEIVNQSSPNSKSDQSQDRKYTEHISQFEMAHQELKLATEGQSQFSSINTSPMIGSNFNIKKHASSKLVKSSNCRESGYLIEPQTLICQDMINNSSSKMIGKPPQQLDQSPQITEKLLKNNVVRSSVQTNMSNSKLPQQRQTLLKRNVELTPVLFGKKTDKLGRPLLNYN